MAPLLLCVVGAAQTKSSVENADNLLYVEAGEDAPRVLSLQDQTASWENRAAESLPTSVEVSGQAVAVVWTFNAAESHTTQHIVSFVYDAGSPRLRLTWEWQAASEHGPIEHEIRIENRDQHEIWLPLVPSLRFDWRVPPNAALEHFYVEKGADTPSAMGTHLVRITNGYEWEGTSNTYAQPRPGEAREIIPYSMVENADAVQAGWYVGIEFSGRTHLTLVREGDSLRGDVGLNPNPGPFRTRLLPGESFVTPRVFLGATSGGRDATGNIVRRWVREVLMNPGAWEDSHYPLAVNNSWGAGTADEAMARRMIRDSAELGLEMFHLDAGWFRGVGDWRPDPRKFPHGLQAIAEEAHAHGLKFGLWADWAQAGVETAPGALNIRDPKVRDWLTTDLPVNWKPEEFKGQTIDIGAPPAKAWAMRETDRIASDYKLDMLEHDGYLVAQGCDGIDHPHAAPDPLNRCTYRDAGFVFVRSSNSTDVSYHAVRAYYEIQANLRKKHPGLLLEICNDGGRMVDFGSAAHGDYFSITDTYDPLSNRRAFYDSSFVLPSALLEAYVERWPGPNLENFRYALRSGMMGWLSIMQDTTAWSPEQHAAAKEEIRLYKEELRPLIRNANLYHISERPDGVHWDGMEYFDSKTHHGAVYAFRGSLEDAAEHRFVLRGLQATARYRLRFHDHSREDEMVEGQSLMKDGLRVRLPVVNSSEIIFLEEAPGQ